MIKRIFVEKKPCYDVQAQELFRDIHTILHIEQLEGLRLFFRYDIEGIDDVLYQNSRYTVFAEPAVDILYEEQLPEEVRSDAIIAIESLPGQYDQRADSAAKCIKLINPQAEVIVKYAKVMVLQGSLSPEHLETIKSYYVNPVEAQIAADSKPETLAMQTTEPPNVEILHGFIQKNQEQLRKLHKQRSLAMSFEDLMWIHQYFKEQEQRDPTITELKVLDAYWSDHCRHTTFNTKLEYINFEEGAYGDLIKKAFEEYLDMRKETYGEREKNISLMDMATLGAKYLKRQGKLKDLDESEEVNACSIKVKAEINGQEQDWLVMFKNETHNHPTEIEPFGGASTCLGGAIRDPLSGRAYVYQAMRVTGAADPRSPIEDTLPGKLPQRKITLDAAAGYSSYGNQIGLAGGLVDEIYDDNYVAKRMELGALVAATPAEHVIRKKPASDDVVLLIGGRTGRDGCGGAAGSSREHTEDSSLDCSAEVQKGDPLIERNIQRLFRRKEAANLIKRCNDFGAGGVSVAIGELADGININLDLVPTKYAGLDGTELAISESQERMAAVVAADKAAEFTAYATEENLEVTEVARITDDNRLRMFWRGDCILDLDRAFLDTNGAEHKASVEVRGILDEKALEQAFLWDDPLTDLNCCSKKGLIERFDSSIGAATVLAPLGGKYQLSPAQGMAAKLPVVQGETTTATLMAYGFDPKVAKVSTYHSALYAVVDSVTKIAAMGADYKNIQLTFQEYFEKLGSDPKRWGKPFAALLGALKAQKELGIPSIGGKDSMSGTFMDIDVPPALLSFAVATIRADEVISTEFKNSGSVLVYFPVAKDKNGILDFETYKRAMTLVRELAKQKKILAASAIGTGGIYTTLAKMAAGNGIGVEITDETQTLNLTGKVNAPISNRAEKSEVLVLNRADYGSILLEMHPEHAIDLAGCSECKEIGRTTEKAQIKTCEKTEDLSELLASWQAPLEEVFPTKTKDNGDVKKISYGEQNTEYPNLEKQSPGVMQASASKAKTSFGMQPPATKETTSSGTVKPRVLIPIFPGTSCEVDSKRAFEKAGGQVTIPIIRHQTESWYGESLKELEAGIRKSQILLLAGGASGGDEPDGSAKFITAIFRNPKIKEAVKDLLENRDGLILGIGNGFQALVKLGLLPWGEIQEMKNESFAQTDSSAQNRPFAQTAPTLTRNNIGRHVSCFVRTRIVSVTSPWLAGVNSGEVHTLPLSCSEGRFVATDQTIEELFHNGQIAAQYVNFDNNPSMDIYFNPTGSMLAIEGLTSADGRILGKMAHSERIGTDLYKNIPGEKDQKIFESGIQYFK